VIRSRYTILLIALSQLDHHLLSVDLDARNMLVDQASVIRLR